MHLCFDLFNSNPTCTNPHQQKQECRRMGNGVGRQINITVPVKGGCGMRRKRMVNPRGMMLETTIVVMFHRLFMTKVDKAFNIKCFYIEADTKVANSLAVSVLPTTELFAPHDNIAREALLPTCKYEVLKGGANGEAVKYAVIGEVVYHKWTCSGAHDNAYCMTVHSCTVDDGQGSRQQIIDPAGCATDRYLLKNLEYLDQLSAGQEVYVFKFADRSSVFFTCQIRLELRDEASGSCDRTSDVCEDASRITSDHRITTASPSSTILSRVDLTVRLGSENPRGIVESNFFRPTTISAMLRTDAKASFISLDGLNSDDGRRTRPVALATPNELLANVREEERHAQRISRDTAYPFAVNLDVTAPSVDVLDLPEPCE
ncbi:Cuticlin-1 [Toxocara canis]|uniref:Cuticlin-1 n=1 Tax=Toxocara canis TaxID=6265 RepID=A0A0B2VNQ5_TOXCA|nr:Cuticlin-1 [Toxocara canis]